MTDPGHAWYGLTLIFSYLTLCVFIEALVVKWVVGRRWSDYLLAALVANVVGIAAEAVVLASFTGPSTYVSSSGFILAVHLLTTTAAEWPIYAAITKRGWSRMLGAVALANLVTTTLFIAPVVFLAHVPID